MAQPLHIKPLQAPAHIKEVDDSWPKPPIKRMPPFAVITPQMAGIRSDEEFDAFIAANKNGPLAVVEFGSVWCQKCHEIFPTFLKLSKQYNQMKYAIAQVDYMREGAKSIRFSPTFVFYRNGTVVDQVLGKDVQKLEDHLWLHSDQ